MKKKKKAAKRKPSPPRLVVLSAKTGKVIRPKKGAQVFFGIKRGKKVEKIAAEFSQKYLVSDFKAIKKHLESTSFEHFLLYEKLTEDFVTDKKGKNVFSKSKKGFKRAKKVYLKKTKLVVARPSRPRIKKGKFVEERYRPVEYKGGRRLAARDIGFRPKTKREIVDGRLISMPYSPSRKSYSKEITVRGRTIKETVQKIMPPITAERLKKLGKKLIVQGIIKVAGRKEAITFSKKLDVLANFTAQVSQVIRNRLGDYGYYYTDPVVLDEIMDDEGLAMDLHEIGRTRKEAKDYRKAKGVSIRLTSYLV